MNKKNSGLNEILNTLSNDIQIQNILTMDNDQIRSYSNGKRKAIASSLRKQGKTSYAEGITTIFESQLYPIIERLLVLKFPHKDIIEYILSTDDPMLSELKESTIKGYVAKLSTGISIAIKAGKISGDDKVNKVYEFISDTIDEVTALQEMIHLQKQRIGIMASSELSSDDYNKEIKNEITAYTRMLKDSIAIKDFYGVGQNKEASDSQGSGGSAFSFASPELRKSIGGIIKNKESAQSIINFINVGLINTPTSDNSATREELLTLDDNSSPEVQAFLKIKKEISLGENQGSPDQIVFETGTQEVMLPKETLKKDNKKLVRQIKEIQRIKDLEDAKEESSKL